MEERAEPSKDTGARDLGIISKGGLTGSYLDLLGCP